MQADVQMPDTPHSSSLTEGSLCLRVPDVCVRVHACESECVHASMTSLTALHTHTHTHDPACCGGEGAPRSGMDGVILHFWKIAVNKEDFLIKGKSVNNNFGSVIFVLRIRPAEVTKVRFYGCML